MQAFWFKKPMLASRFPIVHNYCEPENVYMKNLMCAEAKQIDLVDYLASLGHQPQKVRNQDY
ncbi:hypothetical protein, partial [Chitinophaga sp.]|uniref:hypothetical protein n=1 Tax=Chitinophaga sp. TaxID=1869181 RepID=UPI002D7ED59F